MSRPTSTPGAADLARQIRNVAADLPRFATAPLLRPWHRRWGATRAEVDAPMPGDDVFPRAQLRATRAITIAVPPAEVWPWLVQVGCLRAGWYADDLLDNLAHPSARQIVPELQDLEVGRWLPMAPQPTETTAFVVDSFQAPEWMLWRTPTSTWAWRLVPLPDGGTRLISRLGFAYDWRHPGGIALMELGDWPMMRRMLRGVRERAEAEHRRRLPPPVQPHRRAAVQGRTATWASCAADRWRRRATLAAPVAVPVTMAAAFAVLGRRLPPRPAYIVGFLLYWTGWCLGFPLWVLGPRGVAGVLRAGRRPGPVDVALLAFPVVGAVGAELLPHRGLVDRKVAAVMAGTAAVNAVGEELLWRGVFVAQFPDDVVRGALWPLAGFTVWHLAPQLILRSSRGRGRFLLGAAVVGAASTAVTWRTGGMRAALVPHVLTDACGVRAARFWLGR